MYKPAKTIPRHNKTPPGPGKSEKPEGAGVRGDSVGLHMRRQIVFHKQVVQRTQRTVFFDLVNGHFVPVHAQFNETAPAVKLVGTDLPYIFGVAVRTSHCTVHLSIIVCILPFFPKCPQPKRFSRSQPAATQNAAHPSRPGRRMAKRKTKTAHSAPRRKRRRGEASPGA